MIGGIRYVTIASDASVGQWSNKGRVGLAYYIRDDDGTTKRAWRPPKVHGINSTAAELMAMTEALKIVAERGVEPDTKLVYYCDNITALRVLTGENIKKKWEYYRQMFTILRPLFTEIETRHVKSHTGRDDLKRYYLNRWVDFNARSMMQKGKYYEGDLKEKR